MSGRWTLSAISAPLARSRQRYTWPSEAAAIGVELASRPSKSSAAGRPSSASMSASASAVGYDGTASHSFCSSYTAAGGITSGRIESICPNLMKVGPSAVSSTRSSRARSACRDRTSSAGRPSSDFAAWSAAQRAIHGEPSAAMRQTRASATRGCCDHTSCSAAGS